MKKPGEESAKRLLSHLRRFSSKVMVGIGDDGFFVYVRTRRTVRFVPPEWEGFSVTVRVVGKLKLADP